MLGWVVGLARGVVQAPDGRFGDAHLVGGALRFMARRSI